MVVPLRVLLRLKFDGQMGRPDMLVRADVAVVCLLVEVLPPPRTSVSPPKAFG